MKKFKVFVITAIALGLNCVSPLVEAGVYKKVKAERVIIKPTPKRVIKPRRTIVLKPGFRHVPNHHHHYRYFHNPIVTTLGFAIILNELGEPETEKGQKVVVLGKGDVSKVIEQDGTVYIINSDV